MSIFSRLRDFVKSRKSEWTPTDRKKAAEQGWGLFDVDRFMQLQKHDDKGLFETDMEAWRYVADQSEFGDATCAKAMNILQAQAPDEYTLIVRYTGPLSEREK